MTYPIAELAGIVDPEGYFQPGPEPGEDTMRRWSTDLKCAIAEIRKKTIDINRMYDYYYGDHPQVWLTDKIRSMFKALADQMPENYCGVAIDAPLRRLRVTGFTSLVNAEETAQVDENAPTQAMSVDDIAVQAEWAKNRLDRKQKSVYRSAMVAGEGYLFVWPSDEGGYDITYNDARLVHWHTTDGEVDHVAKVWLDESEARWRAWILYDSGDSIRLRGINQIKSGASRTDIPEAGKFEVDPDDPGGPHGFDRVPVFRFAEDEETRCSRLKSLTPQQDKINKLESNKMVAAEFGAFKQRAYLTTQAIDKESVKQEPDHAIHLHPGGDSELGEAPTSIFEFSATDLSNYDNTKQTEINAFFTIANLPRHLMINPGASPSGAAITADEGPFVELILDMHEWIGATWRELWGMLGYDVEPTWKNPKTDDDQATANTVKTMTDAGVPVDLAVRKYANWDGDEIDQLQASLETKAQADANRQQAMIQALDQGRGVAAPGQSQPPNPNEPPASV